MVHLYAARNLTGSGRFRDRHPRAVRAYKFGRRTLPDRTLCLRNAPVSSGHGKTVHARGVRGLASPDDRFGIATDGTDQRHIGIARRNPVGDLFDTTSADGTVRLAAVRHDCHRRRYHRAALCAQRGHRHTRATGRCGRIVLISRVPPALPVRTASWVAPRFAP